jgi:fibronectin-binding autotransporter adhesin
MKTIPYASRVLSAATVAVGLLSSPLITARAADATWVGADGENGFWSSPDNWTTAPAPGDSLFFLHNARLSNTNDFADGVSFSGITFSSPAGAFSLWGSSIALAGGITNNQVVTPESIHFPITLSLTPTISVVDNASLALQGPISGSGFGLTKEGGGDLTLGATNTFDGPILVHGGKVIISSDANLGAAPGTATPGSLVLDGGALETTSSFTVNANRGIAVGPTTGTGSGNITIDSGDTLTYSGIIADNGGTGGLTKSGFGGLTLSGANTYSGTTSNRVGALTLDFTAPGAPLDNIITGSSDLVFGGENAGAGGVNYARLLVNGNAGLTNSQSFNSTHLVLGGSEIVATSGTSGGLNLHLGAVTHDPNGVVVIVPPTNGVVTTTSTNINGILGGWASIGDGSQARGVYVATDLASVDTNGDIVPFTDYVTHVTGLTIHSQVDATNNFLIDGTSTGDVAVDTDNAASTTDVNTITSSGRTAGYTINIGTNNTLRLGRYGAIIRRDTSTAVTWELGAGSPGAGANGAQGQAVLTAGGGDNSAGELVFQLNANSESSGSLNVDATIADNGTNPVTVVKMGASSMKLRGHNTYSGGTYVLQGRFQAAGNEAVGGVFNPDAYGSGPVYVLPGCYLLSGGLGPQGATNIFFVAGSGTQQEPLGVCRGGTFNGDIHLIGDTVIGGNNLILNSHISGPFSATFGSPATVTGSATIANPANDWTGDTIFTARSNTGNNTIISSNNEVIPNGFGKGNVALHAFSTGTVTWDLHGFNETINGLSTIGTDNHSFIQNNVAASASTLTVGDNDQSSTFGGIIRNNTGAVALTKIGAGVLTITSSNSYTGNTIVNGGILALTGSAQLPNSATVVVNTNGTFDPSLVTGGYTTAHAVTLDSGTFVGNTGPAGIGTLNLTNGQLSLDLDVFGTNIYAGTLNTGGTNLINLSSVLNVLTYPTQFVIAHYIAQSGDVNFGFGSVPNPVTGGHFTNDATLSAVVLVLTNGPQTLTFAGNDPVNPTWWDLLTTSNWLDSVGNSVAFDTADTVRFTDAASTNTVALQTVLRPSRMTINNTNLNYTFTGSGSIIGHGGLIKLGSGSATFMNTGMDGYQGGVALNDGSLVFANDNGIAGPVTIASGTTLQVGNNTGTGTMPGSSVNNSGTLIFNRGADLVVNSAIAGPAGGSIQKNDAAVLELSGNNSFTGAVTVASGTLKSGSATALGVTNGATTISSGATYDVNGFNVGSEPLIVSGTGVNNAGAIINSGADQLNAMRNLTIAGDTTFGGTGRWDIRESAAGNNDAVVNGTANITKIGTNQVSLVGVLAASSLGNIVVQQGTLGIERATALNSASTITVSNGATLELYSNTVPLQPSLDLHGDGATTTVLLNAGSASEANNVTLNGSVIFGGNGTEFAVGGVTGGTADVLKTGPGQLTFSGNVNYSGATVVTNGSLIVDGPKSGGTGITVYSKSVLGGSSASLSENVTLNGGGINPGNPRATAQSNLRINGNVTMNSSSNVFDLNSDVNSGNDALTVNGNLTMTGTNIIRVSVVDHLTTGDTYTLISYSGTATGVDTNSIVVIPPPFGYAFDLVDPATTPGSIQISVRVAIGFDFWAGNDPVNPTLWDLGITTNWEKNGPTAFTSNDFACFADLFRSPNPNSTNITLAGQLTVAGLIFTNGTYSYKLSGSGHISGGELILEGGDGATVTIANSGSNDWTGGVLIDSDLNLFTPAALYVGDGTANGNLGSGTITNDGILVFNHGGGYTNALVVSNNIVNGENSGFFGNYGITNMGSGVVVFAGRSTFTNEVDVVNGIAAAGSDDSGNATAFGSTNAASIVLVTNSTAAIDVNGHSLGAKHFVVSGQGRDGQGVLVNNGPSRTDALQFVTLAGDTTVGGGTNANYTVLGAAGTNRFDIRSGPDGALATLPPGSPYNITKVGGNQFSLVGITNIDPAISNIDIQGGTFAVQTSSANPGDPNGLITVHTNAALGIWALNNTEFNKRVLVHGGGAIWVQSGTSTNIGPITLGTNAADYCTFQMNGNLWVMTNALAGPAGIILTNGSTLHLASANTYAGNTLLYGGTIALENTDLANTPLINLITNNPTIDASGRTDGTLTIISGQTLQGAGNVIGSLTVNDGATLSVGSPTGVLNVTNAVTLGNLSVTLMNVDASVGTNSEVVATNIAYGGALTVSLTGTPAAGQTFQLFNAAAPITGAFTATNLPPLSGGLYWTNILVNGSISIASSQPAIPPTIGNITVNGHDIVISGTNNYGSSGTYRVLSSTNIALPLTNWTTLTNGTFDGTGSFSVTITNGVDAGPNEFYMLQVP